jgi:hypothetical protein
MGKTKFADLVDINDLNSTDLLECIRREINLDPTVSRQLIIRYLFSNDRQRASYLNNYQIAFLYFGKNYNQEKVAEILGVSQQFVNKTIKQMKKRFSLLVKSDIPLQTQG